MQLDFDIGHLNTLKHDIITISEAEFNLAETFYKIKSTLLICFIFLPYFIYLLSLTKR